LRPLLLDGGGGEKGKGEGRGEAGRTSAAKFSPARSYYTSLLLARRAVRSGKEKEERGEKALISFSSVIH